MAIDPSQTAHPPRRAGTVGAVGAWLWTLVAGAIGSVASTVRRPRVPVVLQLSELECGAACLAMVLGFHGRTTRVTECRERAGVGRDGLTALAIVQAAWSFGLRAKAFSLRPEDFANVPLPAIVHWEFTHFVVVERWSPKRVTIVDPASGRRHQTAEEFDAGFTGVVIACEPGSRFDRRAARAPRAWRSYLRAFVQTAPGVLAQVIGASLLLQVLGLAIPLSTKLVVDQVVTSRLDNLLSIVGLGLVVIVLSQAVAGYLRTTLLLSLQARVDARLMLGFFAHLLSLPFRFFEQRTSGDLLMRLSSNAIIRQTMSSQTLSLVLDGTLVLGYLTFLLARDPAFGGIVLAAALGQLLVLAATRQRMHELTQRDIAAQSASQSYLVEALSGVSALKAAGAEEVAVQHWSNLFSEQLNASLRRGRLSAVQDTALSSARALAPLALLWVGAHRVLDGSMSLGTMLALQALAAAALAPLSSLIATAQVFQSIGALLERLSDVLEAEPEQDRAIARPAPRLDGGIELDHVGFRYDPHGPLVLHDISVTISPGQKIALVGPSGSGKSTLAKLMLGLYAPSEGTIRFDGIPLSDIDLRALRRQCGVVLQEPSLFTGSIRDNIAFNNPDLPLDRVMEAATLARIHDEIARLPMGYETRLSEGGAGFSGGQRQRIALARALAHGPDLLVLDEATSHLDAATEALVDQNLNELACTRIVIAHRLSTIRNADLILVMDQGMIVERGTHDDLIARDGTYAALVRHQTPERDERQMHAQAPPRMMVVPVGAGAI